MTGVPEPGAVVAVLVAGWLYWHGARRLWAVAGQGHVVHVWQVVCFGGGLLTVLLALESPLDDLSAALFAAHMVQHMLLILVAGPLLVLGAPLVPSLWAVPLVARRRLGAMFVRLSALGRPMVAFGLHSLALWAWHIPALYEAALRNRGLHVLEHLSFLATAILFWWAVLHAGRVGYGGRVFYVFGLALETAILGAALTFAQAPWYAAYMDSAPAWGLSAFEDQQLAGLIMWVPGGLVYLSAALWLFATWLVPESAPTPGSR
jgi:cytochrome c oxidase assembly factor CtaG